MCRKTGPNLLHPFPTIIRIFFCIAVARVCGQVAVSEPQLRYTVERLGKAQSVEICSPGACGTTYAFELTYSNESWSRFNWPMFAPSATREKVCFRARTTTAEPQKIVVRMLHIDGSEWQSGTLELGENWKQYGLAGADFRLFRGGDPEQHAELQLRDAVQFQIVPHHDNAPGTGVLLVDEIQFLPTGPKYGAEEDEFTDVISPEAEEFARLNNLLSRWDAERKRLQNTAVRLQKRLATIRALKIPRDVDGHTPFPLERPLRVARLSDGEPLLTEYAYSAKLHALADREMEPLEGFPNRWELSCSKLYAALPQEEPEIITTAESEILTHHLHFGAQPLRQTVFTRMAPPRPIDVQGRTVILMMRCTASALNDQWPWVLRLETLSGDGKESWADLRPDISPDSTWRQITFIPANPARSVRFEPSAVRAMSLRLENQKGTAQDFRVEVRAIHLGWSPARDVIREQLLSETQTNLHAERLRVYALRDQIAGVEDAMREDPGLWTSYQGAFITHVGRSAPCPDKETSVLTQRPVTPDVAQIRRATFMTRTHLSPEGATVEVSVAGKAQGTLTAELWDSNGKRLLAQKTVPAKKKQLYLQVPSPTLWEPRIPHRYLLNLVLKNGDSIEAQDLRPVGMRTVDLLDTGPDALLRHAVCRRQPDWSLLWNLQPVFPKMACYHWPGDKTAMTTGMRMLGDLWVDGFRFYGFSLQSARWEQFLNNGIIQFASLAPSYRALLTWRDVSSLEEQYRLRLQFNENYMDHATMAVTQIGNEVELAMWGASLADAFPGALYHPLDVMGEALREEAAPTSPTMYVRAGSFRSVPPLPYEDICGINQYTGRYSGRIDEVPRNLAELAREALFCDRPLAITEWMGPKYSWATGGIGGVTKRGAAYYLERYWRAMVDTPGIVASSEFTLNWVIAPFEDLTTQTREEAWKNRPKHASFGGGYTADHIPQVAPEDAVHGPCFRSMQAFQSPLYLMTRRPGPIIIAYESEAGMVIARDSLNRMIEDLRALGKEVGIRRVDNGSELAGEQSHIILIADPGEGGSCRKALEARGIIEKLCLEDESANRLAIQLRLRKNWPECLLCALTAADTENLLCGMTRLAESAASLRELAELEGAMSRVLAIVDSSLRRYYENYLFEFASRGYVFSGDETRTRLEAAELFADTGARKPAWETLSAVVLDCNRELDEEECQILVRLQEQGVMLIMSRPCYAANSFLQERFPATFAVVHSLTDRLPVSDALCSPIPVSNLGGADIAVIRRFAPTEDADSILAVREVSAPETTPLATTPEGTPVVVAWEKPKAKGILFGSAIGDVVKLHYKVTHRGDTHPIYDRDTACGLERLSRVVVNCCRLGCPSRRFRRQLFIRVTPEHTLIEESAAARFRVELTDVEGARVKGQLRARWRTVVDGRARQLSDCVDIRESAQGLFDIELRQSVGDTETIPADFTYPRLPSKGLLRQLTLQLKAWSPGMIPADGACSVVIQ